MQQFCFSLSCLLLLLLVYSCGSIHISIHGLMSEYKRAWREAPELMESTKNPPPLCEAVYQKERPLQVITAQDLKPCLEQQDKAIVYEWETRCQGEACYLPDVLQAWCTEQGIELYVLSEYYDDKYIQKPYQLEHPILVINHFYYKTPWIQGYFKKFYKDLVGRKREQQEWGRLAYFEQGTFRDFYVYLEDIPVEAPSPTK